MIVNLTGTIWEIIPINNNTGNKAILRGKADNAMTIDMTGFEEWHYDNLEDLESITEQQAKVIFVMKKWGNTNYQTIKNRESKIIFS